MYKTTSFLAATLLSAASASAMPAHPSEVIKVFSKSSALQDLLADHSDYTSLNIAVVHNLSEAVEALCNQKSRSRSIVAVTLSHGPNSHEYFFQTSERPENLKRCARSDGDL